MIDINKMRANPQEMKQLWATRNEDIDVDAILEKDTLKREKITNVEQLKSKRNSVSEQVGKMKKSGEDASGIIAEMKQVSIEISLLDKEVTELEDEIKKSLLYLPNIPSTTTPVGKTEDDNTDIRSWGEKPEFDFEPQAHWDLGEKLDIIDLPRGAKISGSGFILYKDKAARLERALYNWFLDTHSDNGYTEYLTPYLVNREAMTGTGQLPKFEDDAYKTDIDDMFLIPTAEVPVTNIHAQEILEKEDLPKYLTAYTPCWRREAGAAGKDTRGIIRVHQFNKVEMVKLVEPETSYTELETLVADAEQLLQNLGLHYRVIELCSGDLGFSAAKCYDIEVWAPGVGRYLEVSSCSNFEDFQSRRCNIRYRPEKKAKPQFIHTLNGSGLALPRCMVALLETYQNEDGSIDIPDILVPYMNGIDKIQ